MTLQRTAIPDELQRAHGDDILALQETRDGIPTLWVEADRASALLGFLKSDVPAPYSMLYDLTAIDERSRQHRDGQPPSDFTVVYHLLSLERSASVRVKVPLVGEYPSLPSVSNLWPNANWYEREAWDMFGITFDGHPHLERLLMPRTWEGHPLRKEHPARATEMGPFTMSPEKYRREEEALAFRPEEWGMQREVKGSEFMFLNLGPQHPGTHGVLRLVLQLDGEEIVDIAPDIGFHHRAAEKMGERQTWHTYIPYTDRVDYLGGVTNNLPYVMAVEKLAGIDDIPDRAKVIRIMMAELFRIISHLVWYGTFAQDLGQLSPVFYMFTDRERAFEIIESICGARMHPNWFRIGGVAQDLPEGWEQMFNDFLDYLPARLDEYDDMVMKNRIFQARSQGVGAYTTEEAIEWGVTGPGLRATGLEWDARKKMPYSGYDQFEFDIPTAVHGDSYDRAVVRIEEMRQSMRIIRQCVDNMPPGPHRSLHPKATPPLKEKTMFDIETLITHFLNVSWGPVVPPGEASGMTEGTKGLYTYYLVSDGSTESYRTRVRAPSFTHIQMVPYISRGLTVADVLAILGSVDFVLAEVDR
ncbi:MAG: NADH-quinone oxidoreductase subunit C/D [Chloroflexota bacterium]